MKRYYLLEILFTYLFLIFFLKLILNLVDLKIAITFTVEGKSFFRYFSVKHIYIGIYVCKGFF